MSRVTMAVLLALCCALAAGAKYSIPSDALDASKVYWGQADAFDKPAEVKYEKIVQATPEYKELKKDKIKRGTGRYWILLSKASDRAVGLIAKVGQETDYDLIAAEGYLASVNPDIKPTDVTKKVLKALAKNSES